jgi:hypothetical protein
MDMSGIVCRTAGSGETPVIVRMDNVAIVVDDLAAAIDFFVNLGMELEVEARSRGYGWTASWGSTVSAATSRCCELQTATADSS